MEKRKYQICKCCVMDTSDEDIVFDENGVCMRCNEYKKRILPTWNYGNGHEAELNVLIKEIKEKGKGKKYDCILGLSGGLDSSYMLHLAVKEWGLRPFTVRTAGYLITAVYKIAILVFQKSIYWFAFTNTLDMIIAFVLLNFAYRKSGGQKLTFNFKIGKKMLKISYNFIISGLMVAVYAQMDKIMLGQMLDTYTVGLYSVGIYICSLWNFIPDAMIASLRPGIMAAKKVNEETYIRKLKQMYALIIWISILYAVGVCVFSKYIILILYGKDFLGARAPLMIAVWYCGFSLLGSARDVWIICEGHQKYSKWFALIGAMTNLILNLLLIPKIGMIGAAIATLTTQIMTGFGVTLLFKDTRENNKFLIEAFLMKGVR